MIKSYKENYYDVYFNPISLILDLIQLPITIISKLAINIIY